MPATAAVVDKPAEIGLPSGPPALVPLQLDETGRLAEAAAPGPRRLKAIAFDAFPIFSPASVVLRAEALFPGRGAALGEEWRIRQFEYAWLRTLSGNYVRGLELTAEKTGWYCASYSIGGSPTGLFRLEDGVSTFVAPLPFLGQSPGGLAYCQAERPSHCNRPELRPWPANSTRSPVLSSPSNAPASALIIARLPPGATRAAPAARPSSRHHATTHPGLLSGSR